MKTLFRFASTLISLFVFVALLFGCNSQLPGESTTWQNPKPRKTIYKANPTEVLAQRPGKPDFCIENQKIQVPDGDTLQIKSGERLRLIGIDAPELGQKPFGFKSRNLLQNLINSSKEICCLKGDDPTDKYGRTLAYCWAKQRFINAEMIKEGQAYAFFVGEKNSAYKNLFFELEEEAEKQGLGVHDSKQPLPEIPSEWRKSHRYEKQRRN
jgi:micrococcal nuclease